MRIKILLEWDCADSFEWKVNKWLEYKEKLIKVVDIKYSTTTINNKMIFSAIIIYNKC